MSSETYKVGDPESKNIVGVKDLDTDKMIPNVVEVNETRGSYVQMHTDHETGKVKVLELDGGRCLPRIYKKGNIKIMWKNDLEEDKDVSVSNV